MSRLRPPPRDCSTSRPSLLPSYVPRATSRQSPTRREFAIAHRYITMDLDAKFKNPDLVQALRALMTARKRVFPVVVMEMEVATAAAPIVALAMATEAIQTDDGNDGPKSDDGP